MKIATWNVNEFAGITTDLQNQKTTKTINKTNIKDAIDIINKNNFDIICLQEYPTRVNSIEAVSRQISHQTHLKHYYAYSTYDSFLFSGGKIGVALFSRYEISNTESLLFKNPNMTMISPSGTIYHSVDKGIIKVEVEIEKKKYIIITGHAIAFAPYGKTEFDYPESYRPLEEIIKKYSANNLIVAGDFNSEKLFDLLPNLRGIVKDVVNRPTTKPTYEKRGAIQADYILINKNLSNGRASIVDNFSDHYIICVDII